MGEYDLSKLTTLGALQQLAERVAEMGYQTAEDVAKAIEAMIATNQETTDMLEGIFADN